MMLARSVLADSQRALGRHPAAALLGPRQVRKTTLARQLAQSFDGLYLDLENFREREKMTDPRLFLAAHENRLVIFDEAQRSRGPEIARFSVDAPGIPNSQKQLSL
jgi:predicted AAA+ superfamily ATPase